MCFYVKKYQDRTDGSGDTLTINLISVNIQQDNLTTTLYIYTFLFNITEAQEDCHSKHGMFHEFKNAKILTRFLFYLNFLL